ncbi:MAG: hypothetical protein OXC68_10975 [Aestuariivita sp.]|nr:hypothetical protein [Aestuariivita sp.]
MVRFFRFIKSTVFLVCVCAILAVSTIALAVKVVQLGVQVATLTASAAAASAAYKIDKAQAVTQAKARERAKARIKRFAIAGAAVVPVVGMVAAPTMAVSFERAVFDDWKAENPDKDFEDYACETGDITAELVDETLQDLPESMRPPTDVLGAWMPECGVALDEQSWISADTKWRPSLDGITGWMPSTDDLKNLVPDTQTLKNLMPTFDDIQSWIPLFGSEVPSSTTDTR